MRPPASFGRGGGRGGRGGGRGGRGGRGGGRGFRDEGPPDFVVEVGQMMHECESEMVCKLTQEDNKIPYFNAPIFLENKKKIGKVDEVSFF
jgi:H/ACA ribonucleoprotein complex subunit 1